MVRGYSSKLGVGRFCVHAVKEDSHFHLPTLQICAENVCLVLIGKFDGRKRFNPTSNPEFA
jgi:hypothetical protein